MDYREVIEWVGVALDVAGVTAIVVGAIVATWFAILGAARRQPVYSMFRRRLGRAILLGLELLVAADIIKTVAIHPTLESVLVLGLIVLIRTFLSWSLELEITGRWPWQKKPKDEDADDVIEQD